MTDNISGRIKPVDIKALFREKNPRLAGYVPGFVYRYINRIMHIAEVNEIIEKYGDKQGIDFVTSVIEYFNVTRKTVGLENLPDKGRFIFVSNHPLGGFDALLLTNEVYAKLGEARFLVNDVLMNITPLRSIFTPINKFGGNSREAARMLDEQYKSDVQILIFPFGLASRKAKGEVKDLHWNKHFVQKAVEYKRDVIPVHVSGQNSSFFYRLAGFRKFLGIKWNIEMFFLSDETFRHRNSAFTLTFGMPVSWRHFDKTKTPAEWAEEMRKAVYEMAATQSSSS